MNLKFKNWFLLENNNFDIQIVYDEYLSHLNNQIEDYKSHYYQTQERIRSFNFESFLGLIKTKLSQYPNLNNLISAIKSKNRKELLNQRLLLRSYSIEKNLFAHLSDIVKLLSVYDDTLAPSQSEYQVFQQLENEKIKLIEETKKNMEYLKSKIEEAINKIENWSVKILTIKPLINEESVNSANSALISFNNNNLGFTIFSHEGKISIEDIIEGGDEDFFDNDQIQSNYFDLIEFLRNPNRNNESKILTLYTARPQNDRNIYFNATTLPKNIFLANDLSHVDGLASDLSSGEKRDVWKVRINSKYLIQTLNSKIKYYQIAKDNSPIESIELI